MQYSLRTSRRVLSLEKDKGKKIIEIVQLGNDIIGGDYGSEIGPRPNSSSLTESIEWEWKRDC